MVKYEWCFQNYKNKKSPKGWYLLINGKQFQYYGLHLTKSQKQQIIHNLQNRGNQRNYEEPIETLGKFESIPSRKKQQKDHIEDRILKGRNKSLQIMKIINREDSEYTDHQVISKEGLLKHHGVKRIPGFSLEKIGYEFEKDKGLVKKEESQKKSSKNKDFKDSKQDH